MSGAVANDLPPAPRELPHHFVRRWWRSLARHSGLRYWYTTRGVPIIAVFGVLYTVNGFVNGWRTAYDVTVQITSPAEAAAPVLAWILSVAGWLLVPGVAGAVAGYVVTSVIETHRSTTREPLAAGPRAGDDSSGGRACKLIPLLRELRHPNNQFAFNPTAATRFVAVHHGRWRVAQSHLEVFVQDVLTSKAVDEDAYADEAVFQAVAAPSSLLLNTPLGERCPVCGPNDRGNRPREEGAGT